VWASHLKPPPLCTDTDALKPKAGPHRTPTGPPLRAPHLLECLAAALLGVLFATGAGATPIAPNTNLSGTTHNGENHNGADGSGSDLSLATFFNTNLQNTSFVSTSFVTASFTLSNLRFTNATGADFTGATFALTNMRDGNYTNAIFDGATLTLSNVRDADFGGASFLGANLSGAVLWNLADWTGATFDASTVLPAGMDPLAEGMVLVDEPQTVWLLGLGLLGLGFYGRPRRS
jgi:hypothetical protein